MWCKNASNPFVEVSDLYSLDTRRVLSDEAIASVRNATDIGEQQSEKFMKECLIDCSVDFYNTIKKNDLLLFNEVKKVPKSKGKSGSLKSDIQLLSQMYIGAQSRGGDMDSFFEHENHAWPPSLADNDVL